MARAHPSTAPRLHVISGKGGTGKTTVACALAIALARQGKRVLLAEVEGRQGIASVLDVNPLAPEEQLVLTDPSGGEVYGIAVDAKAALLEYLKLFYRLGPAGTVLEKIGAIDFATTIAPGVRDLLLIGKIYEAVGRTQKVNKREVPVYDAVVLDAPPTGRIVRFMGVGEGVSDVARVGPIARQAASVNQMLTSQTTAVHLVTLLEEMPVQETIEAITELEGGGLRLGSIVVNLVRDHHVTSGHLRRVRARTDTLREALNGDLTLMGLPAGDAIVDGLIEEAVEHEERMELQEEQEAIIAAQDRPTIRVPHLPLGVSGGGLGVLADAIEEQGMTA
ncbi:ArsA family ATPase [Kribbia dieselivorans]|uniref:ArsA family ATPase n=1 Tax=Kribbia dieselivorans TaxID=331526 RepID=UPI000837F308|nr:ArsA-related P-loop ATPase [Kribbia dieselivorans]